MAISVNTEAKNVILFTITQKNEILVYKSNKLCYRTCILKTTNVMKEIIKNLK